MTKIVAMTLILAMALVGMASALTPTIVTQGDMPRTNITVIQEWSQMWKSPGTDILMDQMSSIQVVPMCQDNMVAYVYTDMVVQHDVGVGNTYMVNLRTVSDDTISGNILETKSVYPSRTSNMVLVNTPELVKKYCPDK